MPEFVHATLLVVSMWTNVNTKHFNIQCETSGKPAALVDTENPDWIPTVAEMDLLYDTKCRGEGEVISDGIKVEVLF